MWRRGRARGSPRHGRSDRGRRHGHRHDGHRDDDDDRGDDDRDDDDDETTTPRPRPRPSATIPLGVAVAGTLVGGLTPADAREEVQASFRRPLTILVNKRVFKVTPQQLGASAYVGDAVKRARITRVGANVPLKVKVPRAKVERWLRDLAAKWIAHPSTRGCCSVRAGPS